MTRTDRSSGYYDSRWASEDRPGNPIRHHLVVSAALEIAQSPRCPSILEVGCGNGWILSDVAAAIGRQARLYGIEPSLVGVVNSRRRCVGASIEQTTLEEFRPATRFDVIICSEVLEHVRDQPGFVSRLSDLLVRNGAVILTTPNGRYRPCYFSVRHEVAQPIEAWLTPWALRRLLRTRFQIERFSTFDVSFFLHQYPFFGGLRYRTRSWPAFHRAWTWIDWALEHKFRAGLYSFVVARRLCCD